MDHLLRHFFLIFLVFVAQLNCDEITDDTTNINSQTFAFDNQRVAIIGGGIGGSSAAYFLRQLLQTDAKLAVEVDLFEKSTQLGGRLATRVINGKEYETGGSIIHERNRYAVNLARVLKLSKRVKNSDSDKLCIFNGKTYVFCESSWQWITYFKIWFRYGFQPLNLRSKVSQIIDDFEKIYNLQDYKVMFASVDELLDAMSPKINNLTKTSFKEYLMNNGFSKHFMTELVQSITLVNYGQDITIPALVGCVSFAGSGGELWSVRGGNKQLPIQLADNSNANILLNTDVKSVTLLPDNTFEITGTQSGGQTFSRKYNSVIIAMPLIDSGIDFRNFSSSFSDKFQLRKYHRTVSTLVAATVKEKFKGKVILTDNQSTLFTSLSRVQPVDDSGEQPVSVYKLFSQTPLSTEQLNTVFDDIQHVDITDWNAYPNYDSVSLPLPKFILYPGVYHVNAIEWAASAMEMSLIGGKNAALLAFNHLGGKTSTPYAEKVTNKYIADEL